MSSIQTQLVQTQSEFNQASSQVKGDALDKDAFMLLLVTQFQNQDPLNPMEDKEFIAQLAQFTSLEQLMNLNSGMEGVTSAMQEQQMLNATSYIGKDVDANGATISKKSDSNSTTVSNYRYAIGETSTSGTIYIYDSNNQLVNTYNQGPQAAGTYDFTWDGKSFTGEAPDGVYRVVVNFKNAAGDSLQYDAVVSGRVTGALTEDGTTYLTLADGRSISLAGVRRVTEPTVIASSTATSSSTGSSATSAGTSSSAGSSGTSSGTSSSAGSADADSGTSNSGDNTTTGS